MPQTSLNPWTSTDPFEPFRRFPQRGSFRAFESAMRNLFGDLERSAGIPPSEEAGELPFDFAPRIDFSENGDAFMVRAELPGISADEVEVQLQNHRLTISGERKTEKTTEQEQYYRKESSHGRFFRAIPLPSDVQEDEVSAEYKDGMLCITIPKADSAKTTTRKIRIKAGE